MYKTVREGDASLLYTTLPPPDEMALRHVLTPLTGKRRTGLHCGLRSRPLLLISAVLVLGCFAVLVAALLPVLASTSDLETALQSAFTFGGAGQTASVNPNVHHPPSRGALLDAQAAQGTKRRQPFSEEDEEEDDDYAQGEFVAMVSVTEGPPRSGRQPAFRPEPRPLPAMRGLPTARPAAQPAVRSTDSDDEEDDDEDEEDDLSDSIEPGRPGALPPSPPQGVPPGLPPSLLPQRQPPAPAPVSADKLPPLMLDPIMGDGPRPALRPAPRPGPYAARLMAAPPTARPHHKTNNGLYTNEDDLDHNILDLTRRLSHPGPYPGGPYPGGPYPGGPYPGGPAAPPPRSAASTRIFVEALLPSIGGESGGMEPAPPQRRSWIPGSFHWTVSRVAR